MSLTKEQALQQIKELKAYIEGIDKSGGRWVPKKHDKYYHIKNSGDVNFDIWTDHSIDFGKLKIGNVFKTEEEAQKFALRLESMVPTWLPKKGDEYWTIDGNGDSREFIWDGDFSDSAYYFTGQVFKTKQEALDWYERYHKAWEL